MENWVSLSKLIGNVNADVLVGKTCRAIKATNGWGGIEKGEIGILAGISWTGSCCAHFESFNGLWHGKYDCFEVLMEGRADEEDIL